MKSKPSQNHTLEKVTAEEEVPIFAEVGQGSTFAPKILDKQMKMFRTRLVKQQGWGTPGKEPSAVQSIQNKNNIPPKTV